MVEGQIRPAYSRVVLKLGGEMFGGGQVGLDPDVVALVARQIAEVVRSGAQVAVVIGGGNSGIEAAIDLAGIVAGGGVVCPRTTWGPGTGTRPRPRVGGSGPDRAPRSPWTGRVPGPGRCTGLRHTTEPAARPRASRPARRSRSP